MCRVSPSSEHRHASRRTEWSIRSEKIADEETHPVAVSRGVDAATRRCAKAVHPGANSKRALRRKFDRGKKSEPHRVDARTKKGSATCGLPRVQTFQARRLTSYLTDDGQEIGQLSFSEDGSSLVYARGGGKKSGRPISESHQQSRRRHADRLGRPRYAGGEPRKVDAGHSPKISASGTIAYVRDGQIWLAALDGSDKPVQLVVRGQNHSEQWSPDGSRLAFVSSRGDHSFIGVYDVASKDVSYPRSERRHRQRSHLVARRQTHRFRASPGRTARHAARLFHRARSPASLGHLGRRRRHRDSRAKFGTAPRRRRARSPTWPTTPVAASSTGPPTIAL